MAVGFALLAGVATLLVAIHAFAPPWLQARLAFDHGAPTLPTLFTAAYVHVDDAHLFGNLVGYGVVASVTYLVCRQLGRERWFWLTTALLLVVLPVLVNGANYLALATWFPGMAPSNRGFSGVVAGFGGFLLVTLVRLVAVDYGRTLAVYTGQTAVLLLLAEILFVSAGVSTLSVFGAGVAVLALVTFGFGVRLEQRRGALVSDKPRRQRLVDALFVFSLFLLVAVLVYGLFPTRLVVDGRLTNVFAHGVGFVFGALLAVGGKRLDTSPSATTTKTTAD